MQMHIGRASVSCAISIDSHFLRDLWCYSCASHQEISGIGEVHGPPIDLQVRAPLHLLKQKGNVVNTTLDVKDVARLVEEHALSGKDPEVLRFWFHSHALHPVFFSERDHDTLKKLSAFMPVCVAGVVNHQGRSAWEVILDGTITCAFELRIPGPPPTRQEIEHAAQQVLPVLSSLPPLHKEFPYARWEDCTW